jgi:hypothetical protein
MIGRGLIADPLPSMIKIIHLNIQKNGNNSVNFMTLYTKDIRVLSGTTHILLKMHHLWEYFSVIFQPTKYIKKDKKGKSIRNYEAAVAEIIKAGIKFVQLVKKRFHLQWNLFLM